MPLPSNSPHHANASALHAWQQAFKITYPVAMGYFPAGIAFGVLMQAAGLPAWWAILLSLVLYSGAAQYATIPLLVSGASLTTLSLNTAAINLRHIFYALPLLQQLPNNKLAKAYCLFGLTDESFSVLTTLDKTTRQRLFTHIILLNQSYWVCATLIGVTVAAGLDKLIPHLDFALTCLFAILAYEQFINLPKHMPKLLPIVFAGVAFILAGFITAYYLFANYVLLLAISLCVVFILLRETITPLTHKT